MKKRILALILAVILLVGVIPGSVFAADGFESASSAENDNKPLETDSKFNNDSDNASEESDTASGYADYKEKYVRFNSYWQSIMITSDPENNSAPKFVGIGSYPDGCIFKVVDYYLNEATSELWYKIEAVEGYTLTQELNDNPWIFQNYVGSTADPDTLELVNYCAVCQKENCGTDHTTPIYNSTSTTVTDSNGNEYTVIVSGETLPEGSTLTVTPIANEEVVKAELEMEGGFLWDIKVRDEKGNEWQPESGKKVIVRVPVSGVPDGSYVDIDHYPDTVEGVLAALNKNTTVEGYADEFDDAFATMLAPAVEAWQKATNKTDNIFVVDRIQGLEVKDGAIEFETNSFSVYTWSGGYVWSRYTNANTANQIIVCKGNSDNANGQTFYVTNGQQLIFDTGRAATLKKNWGISGAGQSFSDTDGDQAWVTVTGASLGATFNVSYNGNIENNRGTIYFVVVEERTVYFNGNGGTAGVSSAMAITDGGSHNQNVSLPSASRSGYTFLGWYTATSGGSKIGNAGASWMPGSNGVTLYAQWSYDVTYNLNGGSGTATTQTANANNNVTLHGNPSKSGYTFLGWFSSSDNVVYTGGATYSAKKPSAMTALWGKQAGNSSWNNYFYVLPGTSGFCANLKNIDGSTGSAGIVADSNTYYVAPGATLTFACNDGRWRTDGTKTGLTLSAGGTSVGSSAWTGASGTVTLTVGTNAAVGTTMMIYSKTGSGNVVYCARIIVQTTEQITKWSINDTKNSKDIYRVGVYIITDSRSIPGEPNYTTGVEMINVGGAMGFATDANGIVDPSIATSAHYIQSLDGTCTMGVVDYSGHETLPYMDSSLTQRAMDRVIEEMKKSGGVTMYAADGTNLNEYFKANGEEAFRQNYAVRPHIVKLMTGLNYVELGWHIDCSIYALNTMTLTYNLNPPADYIFSTLGTPAPEVGTTDMDYINVTVATDISVNSKYIATVTGATDTAELTFMGWNTKPDGTGTSYAPGSTFALSDNITLYAQWSGGNFTTGTLEVYKNVQIAANSYAPDANDIFTFSINLSGSYSYVIYNSVSGAQISTGTMTNGTFTLKAGQFIRFLRVPVGNYTVSETMPAHYSNSQSSRTVSLKGGVTNQVVYTNVYSNIPIRQVTLVHVGADAGKEGARTYYYMYNIRVTHGETDVGDTPGYIYYYINPDCSTPMITGNGPHRYYSIVVPEKTGYTFGGYFDGENGTGTQYIDSTGMCINNIYENKDYDSSLYAYWIANEYTVTFDPNGGGAPVPASKKVTYNGTYGTLASVSREGYRLLGWFTLPEGGTQITSASVYTVADNSTLYAHWAVQYRYVLSFNKNTSDSVSGMPADMSDTGWINDASKVYSWSGEPERTGYIFAGWSTDPNAKTGSKSLSYTMTGVGAEITNVTLYAVWTAGKYTVTFVDADGTVLLEAREYDYGTPASGIAVPSTPSKEPDANYIYEFNGWDTAISAVTGNVVYKATYKAIPKTVDLTVSTHGADASQSYIFEIRNSSDSIRLRVVLVGNTSLTVRELPGDIYTVTEIGAWSWRQDDLLPKTADLRNGSGAVHFDYGNNEITKWLNGTSYALAKKGGA